MKKLFLFYCLYLFRLKYLTLICIFLIVNNLYGQIEDNNVTSSKKLSPDALNSSVKYTSQDSIIINLKNKKILLFEDSKAYYDDIELSSAYMEFGFTKSELYASGISDSCGYIHGSPVFKQGDTEFSSQEIRYNFVSKKGKITKVITVEGEGFIHGYYIKHVDEKTSFIKGGQYTTCNLPHPHFQIRFNKGKVIQDDKIITGPAYLSFGNVPSPLAIPFSMFPLHKDRSSGIIIPKVGESILRGFYFEDFGYYLGINDNFDLLFSGDISTRLNWAAKVTSHYVFRYKCIGEIKLNFFHNYYGERETPTGRPQNDFQVFWSHKQDPKAHPTTSFSAQINIQSSTRNKYNPTSFDEYLSNQFNSSLNFSTSAKGFFFFDAAVYYNQNTKNRALTLSLPSINMSVRQFYPFRNKNKAGKLKWYDNISMKWTTQAANKIDTKDTLFFKPKTWEELQAGIQHTIPITIPIKMGKGFNWNTNATFTEKWYFQRNLQDLVLDSTGTIGNKAFTFERGFNTLHDLRLSTSLTSTIYVFYTPIIKKALMREIRHVIKPDISFNFNPNLSKETFGTYYNPLKGKWEEYSYYDGSMYGSVSSRMQAVTRFAVNNNLEIKVNSKKDTVTGTRKITIFDNVSISCGYDFAKDSLNWEPLRISGRTRLFSFLDINFGFEFDPYILDQHGDRTNQKEIKVNKRLMRFSKSNLNISVNWRLNHDFINKLKKNEKANNEPAEQAGSISSVNTMGVPNTKPNFNNPWNVIINYNFQYLTSDNLEYYKHLIGKKYKSNIIQTINIGADFNITRKWKVEIISGYDIKLKDFTPTQIKIYRDLHCWEMSLAWVPFGFRKGWEFQIRVKAAVLQDLKLNLKDDYRDNITY
jgi:hypothetical protein